MKRMLSALIIASCCMQYTPLNGQDLPGNSSDVRTLAGLGNAISTIAPGAEERYEEVVGSPYVYDSWLSGTIVLKDGRTIQRDSAFNVDATERGGVVILLPGGDAIDVRESLISEVLVRSQDDIHIYKPFPAKLFDEKQPGNWIVRILFEENDIAFVRHDSKYMKKADYTGAYSAERRYHEYVDEATYYIRIKGTFAKVRLKKNSIAELAPDVASRIRGGMDEQSVVRALEEEYGVSD